MEPESLRRHMDTITSDGWCKPRSIYRSFFSSGVLTAGINDTREANPPTVTPIVGQSLVVCPVCGKKNDPKDTFKCRECKCDNLCLRHQDKETFLCVDCAAKMQARRAADEKSRREARARLAALQNNRGSHMVTFQFVAKDRVGKERRGTIGAGDRAGAIAAIRAQGLFPIAIGKVKGDAIYVNDETKKVRAALNDTEKTCLVQIAPAVHVALGEVQPPSIAIQAVRGMEGLYADDEKCTPACRISTPRSLPSTRTTSTARPARRAARRLVISSMYSLRQRRYGLGLRRSYTIANNLVFYNIILSGIVLEVAK